MRAPIRRGTAQRLGLRPPPTMADDYRRHDGPGWGSAWLERHIGWLPAEATPTALIECVEPISDQEWENFRERWLAEHGGVTVEEATAGAGQLKAALRDQAIHLDVQGTLDNTGITWKPSDRGYWPMPYEHYPADNTTQTDEVSDPTGRYRKRRWWRR